MSQSPPGEYFQYWHHDMRVMFRERSRLTLRQQTRIRLLQSPPAIGGLSGRATTASQGDPVNEETFNVSIRQFLKMVGINSQRHIEQAVAVAMAAGAVKGDETIPARMTLEISGLRLQVH